MTEKEKQLAELNRVVNEVLSDFKGRLLSPTLVLEAQFLMQEAVKKLVVQGKYAIPAGYVFDRVEFGTNQKLQVYFKRLP